MLKEKGLLYTKFQEIRARKAVEGEKVITRTTDGKETENIAESGDFLVENQTSARERYLISSNKFRDRYEKQFDAEDGWAVYKPLGKVRAIELTREILNKLGLQEEFEIEAPWGSAEVVKENDFLVTPPDFTEVYRIARVEFLETYQVED